MVLSEAEQSLHYPRMHDATHALRHRRREQHLVDDHDVAAHEEALPLSRVALEATGATIPVGFPEVPSSVRAKLSEDKSLAYCTFYKKYAEGKCGNAGFGAFAETTSEADDTESEPDAIDELLDPLVCWSQAWARPLALVAVLLASHAACVLLGVALGKAQSKCSADAAPESSAYLTRRFSSGAAGTHARLCVA